MVVGADSMLRNWEESAVNSSGDRDVSEDLMKVTLKTVSDAFFEPADSIDRISPSRNICDGTDSEMRSQIV